jgi:hypothetical protein
MQRDCFALAQGGSTYIRDCSPSNGKGGVCFLLCLGRLKNFMKQVHLSRLFKVAKYSLENDKISGAPFPLLGNLAKASLCTSIESSIFAKLPRSWLKKYGTMRATKTRGFSSCWNRPVKQRLCATAEQQPECTQIVLQPCQQASCGCANDHHDLWHRIIQSVIASYDLVCAGDRPVLHSPIYHCAKYSRRKKRLSQKQSCFVFPSRSPIYKHLENSCCH